MMQQLLQFLQLRFEFTGWASLVFIAVLVFGFMGLVIFNFFKIQNMSREMVTKKYLTERLEEFKKSIPEQNG